MKEMMNGIKKCGAVVAAAVFLLVGCNEVAIQEEKSEEIFVGENSNFPNKIDSVYDISSGKKIAYKKGESVFFTLKLDSSDVNALLENEAFAQISFGMVTNNLRKAIMFKLDGYATDAKNQVMGLRTQGRGETKLNIKIDEKMPPSLFPEEETGMGNYILTKADLLKIITDKGGKRVPFTHIRITPKKGSLAYNFEPMNGEERSTGGGFCSAHPAPPATAGCTD